MPHLLHAGVLSPFSVQDMAGESAPPPCQIQLHGFLAFGSAFHASALAKKKSLSMSSWLGLVPFTVNRAETYGEFFIPTVFSGLDDCGVVKCFCVWAWLWTFCDIGEAGLLKLFWATRRRSSSEIPGTSTRISSKSKGLNHSKVGRSECFLILFAIPSLGSLAIQQSLPHLAPALPGFFSNMKNWGQETWIVASCCISTERCTVRYRRILPMPARCHRQCQVRRVHGMSLCSWFITCHKLIIKCQIFSDGLLFNLVCFTLSEAPFQVKFWDLNSVILARQDLKTWYAVRLAHFGSLPREQSWKVS